VKNELPRNPDKTYNLCVFLAWFEEFVGKRTPNGGKGSGEIVDPLRAVRAEKLRDELETQRGQLLDRERVIMGQICWVQNIVTFCDRGALKLSKLCANEPREKIVDLARVFFQELHIEASKVPLEMNLTELKAKELVDYLLSLRPKD
jgi:hypothetical protein